MLTRSLQFVILAIISLYLTVALANFVTPITLPVAAIVLALSLLHTRFAIERVPLSILSAHLVATRGLKALGLGVLALYVSFVVAGSLRPTIGVDPNVYHLPLALLMNTSVWYPGIGRLSSHMAFANGNSVLASVFTSSNLVGAENIPNLIIWGTFAGAMFCYLTRRRLTALAAGATALVFALTPPFFWQSYNMGTDLPCACFLVLGLLAWCHGKLAEACLLLATSGVFKTFGIFAAICAMGYTFLHHIYYRRARELRCYSMFLAGLVLVLVLLRSLVATGNPLYPATNLSIGSWGIPAQLQDGLVNGIPSDADHKWAGYPGHRNYTGVERDAIGIATFLLKLFIAPHTYHSSRWFSALFAASVLCAAVICVRRGDYRRLDTHALAVGLTVASLFGIWIWSSPVFRYVGGVFVFVNLAAFAYSAEHLSSKWSRYALYAVVTATLVLFAGNVARHVAADVVPVLVASETEVERFLPWVVEGSAPTFSRRTLDGFTYSESSSTYCGRLPPPCINYHSLGSPRELLETYRRWNGY